MRTLLLATLCTAAAPLFAQNKPLVARNFHFDDYRSVIVLDLKTLRDTGVWDEMNTSSLKMTAKIFEEQLGFSIDALDRVTMTRGKYTPEGQGSVFEEISVLEGSEFIAEVIQREKTRYRIPLASVGEGRDSGPAIRHLLQELLNLEITPRSFSEGSSLEEVFLQLTGGGAEEQPAPDDKPPPGYV